jgi:hypothetical protein
MNSETKQITGYVNMTDGLLAQLNPAYAVPSDSFLGLRVYGSAENEAITSNTEHMTLCKVTVIVEPCDEDGTPQ